MIFKYSLIESNLLRMNAFVLNNTKQINGYAYKYMCIDKIRFFIIVRIKFKIIKL